jgi:heparan-alpha-glucosaminide N-acetyltransferase
VSSSVATQLSEPFTGVTEAEPSASAQLSKRNIAVDAYRGLVMLLMMGEVLHFAAIHRAFPDNLFWRILAYNQTHVEWAGLGLHDMIQPSFTFLVGVAIPYSIHSRLKRGETFGGLLIHTIWRSFVLIALGILLRSLHSAQTNFTFEDTLTQIGMGYTFAFLLSFCKPRWQWTAFGAILFAYWLAWAIYPAPGPGFDYASVGVPAGWNHNFGGFASHWNKNSNLGQAFDVWFLNLFPRPSRFIFNGGGYLTLSFIPTLGTMLLGLFAGQWFRERAPAIPLRRFLAAGSSLIVLGALLHFAGICPIVKRIWTPSWTLFSGGICFLFLAVFCWLIDVRGHRRAVFPLVVVGANSLAAYLIAHLWEDFLINNLHTNLGYRLFQVLGAGYEPLLTGVAVMLIYWFALYWMYKNKVFLRI